MSTFTTNYKIQTKHNHRALDRLFVRLIDSLKQFEISIIKANKITSEYHPLNIKVEGIQI